MFSPFVLKPLLPLIFQIPTKTLCMSSNFSIYVEEDAPVDDIAEGPNPAEDAGEINDGHGQPVTGLNDGEELGQENVDPYDLDSYDHDPYDLDPYDRRGRRGHGRRHGRRRGRRRVDADVWTPTRTWTWT